MKALFLLSALLPAGLIASFLGSAAPQQDETRDDPIEVRGVNLAGDPIEIRGVPLDPLAARSVSLVQATASGPAAVATRTKRALAMTVPQDEAAEGRYQVRVVQTTSDSDGPQESGLTVVAGSPLRGHLFTPHPAPMATALTYARDSGKTQQAIEDLRKAKTDEEKADARKQLNSALGDEFDEYLKHQAKELDRLEAKVKKLRGQWDKRREAKDELVALRIQTLENEANGLGWPAGGGNNFWMGSSGGPASLGTGSWNMAYPPMATIPDVPAVVDVNVIADVETEEAEEAEEPEEADADMPAEPSQPRPPRTRNRGR